MGEVTISVAGRAYQVVCEDGEEDRLNAIAARVDNEAKAFGGATPSLSESRLLLMCSLLLADKLDEAEKAGPSPASDVAVDTSGIDDAAARIEALSNGAAPAPDSYAEEPAAADSAVAEQESEAAPEAEAAPEPAETSQSERRSKSSAAMAAEKDLLSWLDRPEPKPEEPHVDPAAPEAPAEDEPKAASDAEPEAAADPAPESEPEVEPEESEEERAARDRAERRARRRERLARLAKHDGED